MGLFLRDLRLAYRQGSAVTLTLAFFVIAVTLFPLGVGPELSVLARIAPGVLWVGTLLSCLLTLDRLFRADYKDGTLDHLMKGPFAPDFWCSGKSSPPLGRPPSLPVKLDPPLFRGGGAPNKPGPTGNFGAKR